MNLTNFLKQTDAITAQYSAEQLSSFIHEIGRILPEHHREDFLARLKAAGSNATETPEGEGAVPAEFEKMYKLVKENLKRIDSQEITLESTLNEEYDDWYNSDVDEFFYMDSKGISEMLEQACSFVHTCMDTERYPEGFKIGCQLFSMEILCERFSQALGWTGTFMKQGIALFLLTLNDGPWFMEGLTRMEEIVRTAMNFSAEQYRRGTDESAEQSDKEVFHKVFLMWKAVEPMAPKVRERAIKRITNLLEKRTEAIMAANRRNYYGECAAYIAAIGEVRESLGEPGAKQRLMSSYKDKYPRRNAFRAALRDYGWIDVKKK